MVAVVTVVLVIQKVIVPHKDELIVSLLSIRNRFISPTSIKIGFIHKCFALMTYMKAEVGSTQLHSLKYMH